ncbi:MAG: hypothetical protein ACRDWI_11675 [Jiangellaceae bacterium]
MRTRPPVRLALVASVTVVALGAAGCTGSDTDTPVPETAEAPFGCPGVPLRGAELMSGEESLEVAEESGDWGDVPGEFFCFLQAADDDESETAVIVEEREVESAGFGGADEVLEMLRTTEGGHPIESRQPGEGYAFGFGSVEAWWVCEDRLVKTTLFTPVEGRDPHEDVSRYLGSMLPWACGSEDVPGD